MNLPFLAINRGHGSVSALGSFRNGVLIKLNNLVSIDVAADGKSAVLGGYQGSIGLMADSFIEMDIVTADGSEITVSESSHPDLFWAMRGAGQNFGIVTKFRYRIMDYPDGRQDIFHATYHFTENQLEVLF
ncbi:MAG: hypothetical protein Q9173_002371, partial [Seirophora scorigena]